MHSENVKPRLELGLVKFSEVHEPSKCHLLLMPLSVHDGRVEAWVRRAHMLGGRYASVTDSSRRCWSWSARRSATSCSSTTASSNTASVCCATSALRVKKWSNRTTSMPSHVTDQRAPWPLLVSTFQPSASFGKGKGAVLNWSVHLPFLGHIWPVWRQNYMVTLSAVDHHRTETLKVQ